MKMIGITGGIGAGKSVVSRMLRTRGYEVYDCDLGARRLMEASVEIKQAICERLGVDCLLKDGSLDRRRIAGHVFGNDDHRQWLNRLVHQAVRDDIMVRRQQCAEDLMFVESALMRTSGLDRMCDIIWIVDAPESLRVGRASSRNRATRESILARIRAQAGELTGFASPVEVITNDGTCPLIPQIDKLLSNESI